MTIPTGYKKVPVRTWFLTFEGNPPDISFPDDSIQVERWTNPPLDEYLEIYKEIGQVWGWSGRLLKSAEELEEILHSPSNEVWLFRKYNEIAGFFELVRAENETEIVYLGLRPAWIGKGLGHKLILSSVSVADPTTCKVWLHTCERDHPGALKAYLKAGFKIEKELILMEYYPAEP